MHSYKHFFANLRVHVQFVDTGGVDQTLSESSYFYRRLVETTVVQMKWHNGLNFIYAVAESGVSQANFIYAIQLATSSSLGSLCVFFYCFSLDLSQQLITLTRLICIY